MVESKQQGGAEHTSGGGPGMAEWCRGRKPAAGNLLSSEGWQDVCTGTSSGLTEPVQGKELVVNIPVNTVIIFDTEQSI